MFVEEYTAAAAISSPLHLHLHCSPPPSTSNSNSNTRGECTAAACHLLDFLVILTTTFSTHPLETVVVVVGAASSTDAVMFGCMIPNTNPNPTL
jgi:hypothetical protein